MRKVVITVTQMDSHEKVAMTVTQTLECSLLQCCSLWNAVYYSAVLCGVQSATALFSLSRVQSTPVLFSVCGVQSTTVLFSVCGVQSTTVLFSLSRAQSSTVLFSVECNLLQRCSLS